MSKSLTLVSAGASASLLQAAASIVSKATNGAVRTSTAPSATASAVVVGTESPAGVVACIVSAPAAATDAYKGVRTAIVRAVLPRGAPDTVTLRDALDVLPAAGISAEAEVQKATAAFQKASEAAIAVAKERQAKRVTLVIKEASKYSRLNELFVRTATAACEAKGLSVEVMHTAKAANDLVVFPEKFGVVLTNDEANCENIQRAFAGVTGGAASTYVTAAGSTISGGHSHKTVALAIARELKAMGLTAEASKIEAAAEKSPLNVAAAL